MPGVPTLNDLTQEEESNACDAANSIIERIYTNRFASSSVPQRVSVAFYEAIVEACRDQIDAIREEMD